MSRRCRGRLGHVSTLTSADLRQWSGHLADERSEARIYRDLARRRGGEEREILFALAETEGRHAAHWEDQLDDHAGRPHRPGLRFWFFVLMARCLGSVFVLALVQRAESRAGYAIASDVAPTVVADERIHAEVVRALAMRDRNQLAGSFRAALFGVNGGLVSNTALVTGVAAVGMSASAIMLTGLAGLFAGALSMAAGEFISVRSQRELLDVAAPGPTVASADDGHGRLGAVWGASISSFCLFASGAVIPVIPYLFGMTGVGALVTALAAVGVALLGTGTVVGLISGGPLLWRALRQLGIGYITAAVTYGLGIAFGSAMG